MREIRVTGKGKVVATPDKIVLNIELKGTEVEYKKAYQRMEYSTKEVKELFQELSFEATDLKTKKCEIETRYNREYNEKKEKWETVFSGYEFVHKMTVAFDKDNLRLGKILKAFS